MATEPSIAPVWRIDLDRYHELIERGWFRESDRVELIEGVLTEMSPKGARHDRAISVLADELFLRRDRAYEVRVQSALTLTPSGSEPEPDLAVIPPGAAEPYHPATAALVIEVAASSLAYDRVIKARLYARAEIPEYWIVNLVDMTVEVHREPGGEGYRRHAIASSGALVPESLPSVSVDLDALFTAIAAAPPDRDA